MRKNPKVWSYTDQRMDWETKCRIKVGVKERPGEVRWLMARTDWRQSQSRYFRSYYSREGAELVILIKFGKNLINRVERLEKNRHWVCLYISLDWVGNILVFHAITRNFHIVHMMIPWSLNNTTNLGTTRFTLPFQLSFLFSDTLFVENTFIFLWWFSDQWLSVSLSVQVGSKRRGVWTFETF